MRRLLDPPPADALVGLCVRLAAAGITLSLTGCATVGAMMSPYSERYSCKNKDHGQCIHPERAYEDALTGIPSRSDPMVANDPKILHPPASAPRAARGRERPAENAYDAYRDSVYQELKGLIEAPVTPMLRPARTLRTLILPYADRQRPDRLYMPRYVYSIVDRPEWVVGSPLSGPAPVPAVKVLRQTQDHAPGGDVPEAAAKPVAEPQP